MHLVPEVTATKKASNSNLENERTDLQENYSEGERKVNGKQTIVPFCGWKEKAPIVVTVLSQSVENAAFLM